MGHSNLKRSSIAFYERQLPATQSRTRDETKVRGHRVVVSTLAKRSAPNTDPKFTPQIFSSGSFRFYLYINTYTPNAQAEMPEQSNASDEGTLLNNKSEEKRILGIQANAIMPNWVNS